MLQRLLPKHYQAQRTAPATSNSHIHILTATKEEKIAEDT